MISSSTIRSIRPFWFPGLILLLALPALLFQKPYFSGTDLSAWINDWSRFSECMSVDTTSCGRISFFPLAYLLNSWILSNLENAHIDIPLAISAVNIFFVLLPLLFIATVSRTEMVLRTPIIYITAILSTSLPAFYIHSGALEIQSGIIIGIFISSWILLNSKSHENNARQIIIFLIPSGILMTFYKDTNLAIVIGALIFSHTQQIFTPKIYLKNNFFRHPKPSHLVILFLTLLLGIGLAIGYNHLRYQTFAPTVYLSIAKATSPSPAKSLEFLLATFLSPNGGILIFWLASLMSSLLLMRRFDLKICPAAITTSLVLITLSALGFSLWWAPFGWDAWGDRLMIPAALASLIIIISTATPHTITPQTSNTRPNQNSRVSQLLLGTVLAALTIPSIYYTASAYYSNRAKLLNSSLFGGKHCKEMMIVMRDNTKKLGLGLWRSEHYYKCAKERFTHIPKLTRSD